MFSHAFRRKATAIAALLSIVDTAPTSKQKRDLTFDYNNVKVRGVNLGGWFVLEPWITPSIFDPWQDSQTVVDEYTLSQTLGPTAALNLLSNHWNTWIVQDDFNQIAAAGLNHVRIPIGYWAIAPLAGDPYVQGQVEVLDQAIGWARTAGLKVMIDLHGAPLSQNGFDNSGRKGAVDWEQGDSVAQTKNAVTALAQRYASQTDVVTAIEVLNEPLGPVLDMSQVKQFYLDGWGTIRDSNPDTAVTIHDAFQDPVDYWNGFMNTQSGVNNVILDHHEYQIFTQALVELTPPQHIQTACTLGPKLAQTDKWLVVGEFTGAQTDCAQWLNGLGVGARYDGTYPGSTMVGSCDGKFNGTVDGLSQADKTNLRMLIEAQLDAYEQHTGWIWWTWKAEAAPEWNLQALIAGGLFPKGTTERFYPNQCGY